MTAANPDHARAAMKAALANVELALAHNGVASNAIVVALTNIMAGNQEKANSQLRTAIDALRSGREAAMKVGEYATEAFG